MELLLTFNLIREGNKTAFKKVFEEFYSQLVVFSLKYGLSEYEAEEVVENTFIKLWEKKETLDKIKNPKSFLYKMVANASIDSVKKQKKTISLESINYEANNFIEESILEEEVHSGLFKILDSLPKKCKKVFILSCIEGLKYKDIAEDLDISINTVKSQRARAIKLIKEQINILSTLFLLFFSNYFHPFCFF